VNVEVIDRQPATIACLRHTGPYGKPVGEFWEKTYIPWATINKLDPNHARYGISYDNPNITPPEQCRYDACAEVSPDFVATGDAVKTTIPGGKYATLKIKFSAVEPIIEAWAFLFQKWLPSSGFQLDNRPCFEYYPKDVCNECEICIPVAPLQK
jgi:AraC family transcriptional regulator